jgi:acetyltransferase-like isoleucine patch superfamily enzyme
MSTPFERWLLSVKRRDSTAARIAHDAYRTLLTLNVPDTPTMRSLYGLVNVANDVLTEASEWLGGKLLFEPMLRARCHSVGARVQLHSKPYIRGHAKITIGDDCRFSSFEVASGRFVDHPELVIGSNVVIASHVLFAVNKRITVEDHVGIAGDATIRDSDGHPSDPDRRMRGDLLTEADIAPVRLCEYAWIGRGAQVMKGVTVGRGAIVGSGSVVSSDVPDGAIAMGVPARIIKR